MIATSSPKAATSKTPYANPSILPSGSIDDYRISSGPYAGMTYKEMLNYMRGYSQSVDQATNGKPSKPLTGSTQGDQALGLLGGVGTAAAIKYGIGQLGATAATSAAAGSAGAAGASSAVGAGLAPAVPTMVAGSTAAGAGAAGTAAGTAGSTGSMAGTASSVAWPLAIAAATYMAGKNYEDRKSESGGALSNQDVGTMIHMFGVPKPFRKFQAWVDDQWWSPAGMTSKLLGAGKNKQEQGARKVNRTRFQDAGLMGKDSRSTYNTLADGSGFNISDYKTRTGSDAYNINFDGTEDADRIGFADALTAALMGTKTRKGSAVKDGKTRSDLSGELYNSWMSNGQGAANARFSGDKLGGRDAIYQGVLDQWRNERLTADQRDSALAAIDKEYGIANPTNTRWDASLTGKDAERNQKEFEKAAQKAVEEDKKKKPEAVNPRLTDQRAQAVKKPIPISNNPRFKGK